MRDARSIARFGSQLALLVSVCVGYAVSSCTFADAESSKMDLSCVIRATSENGLLRLEAVAQSRKSAIGNYNLSILKQSATGTSQNMQAGEFNLKSGREQILTTVVLDGSALGHYRAKLSLESNVGSVSCSSP